MRCRSRRSIALLCVLAYAVHASEVSGKIWIEKKLARRPVAGAVYDLRGVSVPDPSSTGPSSSGYEGVAVWLDSPTAPAPPPVTASLQQKDKRFQPELVLIPVGSTLEFPNLDPIFHNIFSLSRTASFDLGYYAEGKSRSVRFSQAGIVQVYCHVHPEMHAVIVVTATPWSCKPQHDGTFEWANVPPGKYKLGIWQRSVGLIHRSVSVPQTGTVQVNISLPDDTDK